MIFCCMVTSYLKYVASAFGLYVATRYFILILFEKPFHQTDSECQFVNKIVSVLSKKYSVQHYGIQKSSK
jgi:hypothetical protein